MFDKFTHIRAIFDKLITNCQNLYTAGPVLTVDEMLASFYGRVPFKMYIPSKPAKYGIKIFMINDASSQYCINAIPYLGKGSTPPLADGVNQGEYFTMKLIRDCNLLADGRVIVMDNWFTSTHLVQTLKSYNMHVVGTIRMNKAQVPSKTLIKDLKLPKGDTVAFYNHQKEMTLAVKKVKAEKYVGVISTIHNKLTVVEGRKTEAHMFYNASKGGTDAFDALCSNTTCSRMTRRWPMAIFYQMINISMNNAWILYSGRTPQGQGHITKKSIFLFEMAYNMCRPWAIEKYHRSKHHPKSREMIHATFSLTPEERTDPAHPVIQHVPDIQPQPQQPDQPAVAIPPWLPIRVPDSVIGATRQENKTARADRPPLSAFLGGRWLSTIKKKCSFCHGSATYSGKNLCESPRCQHKPVCVFHSVILCQECLYWNQPNQQDDI